MLCLFHCQNDGKRFVLWCLYNQGYNHEMLFMKCERVMSTYGLTWGGRGQSFSVASKELPPLIAITIYGK